MPDQDAEWWSTSEVAEYLQVKGPTVTNYARRNQMPAPEVKIGRTPGWRPATIIAWHAARPRVHRNA